jgi:hypothetical protein
MPQAIAFGKVRSFDVAAFDVNQGGDRVAMASRR